MTNSSNSTVPKYLLSLALSFFFVLFAAIFILSFPFSYHLLPDIGAYTTKATAPIAGWLLQELWPGRSFEPAVTSDAATMYMSLLVAGGSALLLAFPVALIARRRQVAPAGVWRFFTVCAGYYLALQMWKYGFNKVFRWQFPMPEPNLLFTRLGNVPKDMLYWSTMGVSPAYTLFSGIVEVIPGFLLCFRRTRALGAFLLTGVLLNVVWINFSYDISVKVYSSFLLLLSLLVALPVFRLLGRFFILGKMPAPEWMAAGTGSSARRIVFKILLIGFLLLESLWPYLRYRNFNDDIAARPPLHGAWEVTLFIDKGDTLLPGDDRYWDRFFVHRRGYFITQTGEQMQDYKLYTDTSARQLELEAYDTGAFIHLPYRLNGDSLLEISGPFFGDTIIVQARKLPLDSLPLMQREFHWVTDP